MLDIKTLPAKHQATLLGEWHASGYLSAFTALAAAACYVRLAGATEAQWMRIALPAAHAVRGKRTRNQARAEKIAAKVWASAARITTPNGVARVNPVDVDELCAWRQTLATMMFVGRTGASDRKVLDALTRRAEAARTLHGLNASRRLLQEETLLSANAVTSSLTRLVDTGLVERVYNKTGAAARVTLLPRADVAAVDAYGAHHQLLGTMELLPEGFARRGLARHHHAVYVLIAGGHADTAAEVAEQAGITVRTANATLARLVDTGLVERTRHGHRFEYSLGAVSVDEVAASTTMTGQVTVGARERRRVANADERAAYDAFVDSMSNGEQVRKVNARTRVAKPTEPTVEVPVDEAWWIAVMATDTDADATAAVTPAPVLAIVPTPASDSAEPAIEAVTAQMNTVFTGGEMVEVA